MRVRTETSGFSVLEMTATLFVLTVGIYGITHMYWFGLDKMRATEEANIAVQAIHNEIETLRATPFALLADGTHAFRCSEPALEKLHAHDARVTVGPVDGAPAALKQVEVSIAWTTENARRTERRIVTYIGERTP